MVIAGEMQQPVQQKHLQFIIQAVSKAARLLFCDLGSDGDIPAAARPFRSRK